MLMEEEIDLTKLRYVLYARKSTDDPLRQLRSIPDQISECLDIADRKHLNVVNRNHPLTETKSAKTPKKRPVFEQMLRDIRNGKYDAILAWNPDRLARNMLEAGMIIDMADTGVIKDFQFVTHVYSPDANGKMLLGMSFVLSKQYSDKLSQDVTRGVRNRFNDEGKTPTPKHGYINENGVYRPDMEVNEQGYSNFQLICEAWQMRLNGESLEKITDYINTNGYRRKTKKDDRIIKMDKRILTKTFRDPFYMGILIQAGQETDLRQLPGYNFKVAVSPEEYNQVQLLSRRRLAPYNIRKAYVFYPFKALIQCHYCGHNMVVGPSRSGGTSKKQLLYYRCDNPDCEWKKNKNIKPRNLRGKVILNFLKEFFAKDFNLTDEDFNKYEKRIEQVTGERRERLRTQLRSLNGSLTALETEIKERSLKLVDMNLKGTAREINEEKITESEAERDQLRIDIEKLKAQLSDPEHDKLSLEQVLNLVENAEKIIKSADNVKKDVIVRIIFLNLEVDNEKVTSYRLKPLFETMKKIHSVNSSRSGEN